MSDRMLTTGDPVPADYSHTEINLATGMQRGYVVLTAEERAKGFVKRVRYSYVHKKCGAETRMGASIAETYARDPNFYSGTFCVSCRSHFPLDQFEWSDGEPMHPPLQAAWHEEQLRRKQQWRKERIAALSKEIEDLEAESQ